MHLAELVAHYGYGAVLVGSLLEGETVLLLAGAAAQKGYLSYFGVCLLAFVGGTLGDQVLFAIGRRHGIALLHRYPTLEAKALPVRAAIVRHQSLLIVGVRFMYGLRLAGPFVIGMSPVSSRRFLWLNMLGAAIWAPAVVGVGYLFGHTLEWLMTDIARFEAAGLVVVVGLVLGVTLLRARQRRQRENDPAPPSDVAADAATLRQADVATRTPADNRPS
ncbi:MAG: DedA family protein [Pseudomonadota bacterium]|nr:DedA family protein [Pseudomonadota bacterium]